MAKTKLFESTESGTGRDLGTQAWIYCPGCKHYHFLRIRMPAQPTQQEIDDQRNNVHGLWTFNGDVEQPTFTASLLVGAAIPGSRCHSQITAGYIIFYADCDHALKNESVELPQIDL